MAAENIRLMGEITVTLEDSGGLLQVLSSGLVFDLNFNHIKYNFLFLPF